MNTSREIPWIRTRSGLVPNFWQMTNDDLCQLGLCKDARLLEKGIAEIKADDRREFNTVFGYILRMQGEAQEVLAHRLKKGDRANLLARAERDFGHPYVMEFCKAYGIHRTWNGLLGLAM